MSFNPGGGGGSSSIASSTDVSLNSLQNDQSLVYDQSSDKWQNRATGSAHVYAIASNVNGTWPTFASVHPGVSVPLPDTAQVMWYVRSSSENATIPSQFEDIDAPTRPIGGLHSIYGYPYDSDGSTGGGTIALVGQTTAASTFSSSLTVNRSTTAGSTLILHLTSNGGNTVIDSAGGAWTLLADTVEHGASGQRQGQLYYRLNAPAVTSVSVTRATDAYMAASLTEWSGIGSVRSFTVDGTAADPVPAQIGDLVYSAIFQFSASGTPTATPSGFTGLSHAASGTTFVTTSCYRIAATAGNHDPDWNNGSIGEINVAFAPGG